MEERYPIENGELAGKMREVVSLLTHWEGVMGVAEFVPAVVFPFVCLFGSDSFLCF